VYFEIPKLIGKEKKHYETLENLYAFSCGESVNESKLCERLKETITDWDKMMGGRGNLQTSVQPYLEAIEKSNREKARNLYLFLSPTLFYIHVLYEMKRRAWRLAMTWGGIYCERIVRNLFQEIDRRDSLDIWQRMSKDPKFENRNNRLRKELEERHVEADSLCSFLKSIYFTRSHTGPHDVPPPEPIQADLGTRLCLPVYVKYLEILIPLGNDLTQDFQTFVSFFYNLAETNVALVFPEEEIQITPKEVIKDTLYRQGFFREGKSFRDIQTKIGKLGYNWVDSRIANELEKLSKGRNAILTRKGRRRFYKYFERYPPEKFFKTTI